MDIINSNWSDERTDRLQVLYQHGLSFSLIAEDIGVTRNAAIGKAHRLNLPKRGEASFSKISGRRAAPKPRSRRRSRPAPAAAALATAPELPAAVEVLSDHDYRCPITALEDCSCRYPLWEPGTPHPQRLYCGQPDAAFTAGFPYCQHHTARCVDRRPLKV